MSEVGECDLTINYSIPSEHATAAALKQVDFFKGVTDHLVDVPTAPTKSSRSEAFQQEWIDPIAGWESDYAPSETVIMERAYQLIQSGIVNIPDVGAINVKQARAFLWNAAWLQEFMNKKWRDNHVLASHATKRPAIDPDSFALAIMGAGGTGKSAILRIIEAFTVYFAGVDTVRKAAPSNAAARQIGGDTLHALCKFPFGDTSLQTKKGRLTSPALRQLKQKWEHAIQFFLDEISMVPADQFLHCHTRLQQAKTNLDPYGSLALNVCGDFLQLPPVDPYGSKKSLAQPIDAVGNLDPTDVADDSVPHPGDRPDKVDPKRQARSETRQGRELWCQIPYVVNLEINVRAPGVLSRMLAEMRDGKLSDEMWDLYESRVLQPNDPRLTDPNSPFAQHPHTFIVHRHNIRNSRSLEHAKQESCRLKTPLYLLQAKDETVHVEEAAHFTADLQKKLLNYVNPDKTKNLPSFLPLHVGMRVLLNSKDCVNLGLVKGCTCTIESIILADDETVPAGIVAGRPHHLRFMPTSLLLRADNVDWQLYHADLPLTLPRHVNRRGLFQIRPSCGYLRVEAATGPISIRRCTFRILPADTATVYTAQGGTYDAVIADMEKPPVINNNNNNNNNNNGGTVRALCKILLDDNCVLGFLCFEICFARMIIGTLKLVIISKTACAQRATVLVPCGSQ